MNKHTTAAHFTEHSLMIRPKSATCDSSSSRGVESEIHLLRRDTKTAFECMVDGDSSAIEEVGFMADPSQMLVGIFFCSFLDLAFIFQMAFCGDRFKPRTAIGVAQVVGSISES